MTTLCIDGNNLAYRVRYTYSLSNKNEDTSVLYGFIMSMQSEIKKHDADSVIVCWDKGVPKYRKELFPEYKANRHKEEDEFSKEFWADFRRQMDILKEFIPYLGVVSISVDGYEADDLLYSAAKLVLDDVVIVSTDADVLQTVDHKTRVHNPVKKFTVSEDNFQEVIGVKLGQYIDYKIMTGDSSDNIEGIRGIGEKTAIDILSNYLSLSEAMEHLDNGDWKASKIAKTRLSKADENRAKNLRKLFDLSRPEWEMVCQIYDAIDEWMGYDSTVANAFLLRHSFVSLMGGKLRNSFSFLVKPVYCNPDGFIYAP